MEFNSNKLGYYNGGFNDSVPNLCSMVNKQELHLHCLQLVQEKLDIIQTAIRSANDASQGDTKSSAGDKYETTRAMMQQELDRLGKQLQEARLLEQRLQKTDPQKIFTDVRPGSLLKTNSGWYYLVVGLGKVTLEGTDIMVLSPEAPLARILIGKKPNEVFTWNNRSVGIELIL